MRLLLGGRVRMALPVAVVIGLAAGGIAYASIPDGSGVIHGCYKNSGGSLRVIDTTSGGACNASETPLSWSQTGPPGTNGTNGTNGTDGARGPTGPSDAWAALNDDSFGTQQLQPFSETTVQSLSLPTGSYVVNASLAFNSTSTSGFAHCQLFLGNNYHGGARQSDLALGFQMVPFTSAFTIDTATTVSIQCFGDTGTSTQPSQMTAIRVGSLTVAN